MQGCKTYTKAVGSGPVQGPVLSTILVPDSFKLGTAKVANVNVNHQKIGALKVKPAADLQHFEG